MANHHQKSEKAMKKKVLGITVEHFGNTFGNFLKTVGVSYNYSLLMRIKAIK